MSKLRIPEKLFQGFVGLLELKPDEFNQLIFLLSNLENINDIQGVAVEIESKLHHEHSKTMAEVIISLGSLRSKSANTDIISELFDSYIELNDEKNLIFDVFKERFEQLLKSISAITCFFKKDNLLASNENIFDECEIITDIRLMFNDEIKSSDRRGIILHKLKIDYNSSKQEKEIYFTLDMKDLISLKASIERAITKEKQIISDYKQIIKFDKI